MGGGEEEVSWEGTVRQGGQRVYVCYVYMSGGMVSNMQLMGIKLFLARFCEINSKDFPLISDNLSKQNPIDG